MSNHAKSFWFSAWRRESFRIGTPAYWRYVAICSAVARLS